MSNKYGSIKTSLGYGVCSVGISLLNMQAIFIINDTVFHLKFMTWWDFWGLLSLFLEQSWQSWIPKWQESQHCLKNDKYHQTTQILSNAVSLMVILIKHFPLQQSLSRNILSTRSDLIVATGNTWLGCSGLTDHGSKQLT